MGGGLRFRLQEDAKAGDWLEVDQVTGKLRRRVERAQFFALLEDAPRGTLLESVPEGGVSTLRLRPVEEI